MADYRPKSYWTNRRRIRAEIERCLSEIREPEDRDNALPNTSTAVNDFDPEMVPQISVGSQSGILEVDNDHNRNGNLQYTSDSSENENEPQGIKEFQAAGPENDDNEDAMYIPGQAEVSDSEAEIEEPALDIINEVRSWALSTNIPHQHLGQLLAILRQYFPNLPKDPRTLLKTPDVYDIKEMVGGFYYHFGIEKTVKQKLMEHQGINILDQIVTLQLNIDGLPLFKSSSMQFWPILGILDDFPTKEPFVIGLYSGTQKPGDLSAYLEDFVTEMGHLNENGLVFENETYHVRISSVICDTPARAFVKAVKAFNGFSGCDKCTQPGVRLEGRTIFPVINFNPRTDESFVAREDARHQCRPYRSPFLQCEIGMVSQFPVDYMHCVCLGVVKKLLSIWIKGPLPHKLGANMVKRISDTLVGFQEFIPKEFSRKPRPLTEIERWKATEFRQFLLYSGPVALKNILSEAAYAHFLSLFVAIHILVSPRLSQTHTVYAENLLKQFVEQFGIIYGREMLIYNVHALIHLPADVRKLGCLDNYSSFPYENFLGQLKRLVRKPSCPLQQVIRRVVERQGVQKEAVDEGEPLLKREHYLGPVPLQLQNCQQYKEVCFGGHCISVYRGNNCICYDDKVGIVVNIVKAQEPGAGVSLICRRFRCNGDFFQYPLSSHRIGVKRVSNLTQNLYTVPIQNLQSKCVLLPYQDTFVSIPMTKHTW